MGKEEAVMNERKLGDLTVLLNEKEAPRVQLGQNVPNFQLDAYFPTKEDFGKISLDQLKKDNKWTILFFYPADFTFV